MTPEAPGTILQRLYLRERLREVAPGRFVEVGVGTGRLSRELIRLGWRGEGWDISEEAAARATETNPDAIGTGRYVVHRGDWLAEADAAAADLVVSSMVIEHLSEAREARYFIRCRETLAHGGRAVLFVPASPRHWGIEDEIAGHLRRYTRTGLRTRLEEFGFRVDHVAGLTFPISNALLPISNALVRRAEGYKRHLSQDQQTRESGTRSVSFKTTFPRATAVILNERALYPLHLLQKLFRDNDRALVLYAEATPRR
jgi:SAM-dependent methyltransferase